MTCADEKVGCGFRNVVGEPFTVSEGDEAVFAAVPDEGRGDDVGHGTSPWAYERKVVVDPARPECRVSFLAGP